MPMAGQLASRFDARGSVCSMMPHLVVSVRRETIIEVVVMIACGSLMAAALYECSLTSDAT